MTFTSSLLQNEKWCFQYKKKWRGKGYHSDQLKDHVRWPFPSIHNKLARGSEIKTHRLYMKRGYPAAIRTINKKLYGN
jgi:hypothetical protein